MTYKLDSGPDGMTVSDTGLVQWKPIRKQQGAAANAILVLTDSSGKEAYHTFDISVKAPAGSVAHSGTSSGSTGHRGTAPTAGEAGQTSRKAIPR